VGRKTLLARSAAGIAQSIDAVTLQKITAALLSLGMVLYDSDVDLETFVHDVVGAMSEMVGVDQVIKPDESLVLEDRFQKLLDSPALKSASKSGVLRSDFPNTFCDAKILTDVRPIFGDDPRRPPPAAIITHTLKIEYHHSGNRKHGEFYVGLDGDDLETIARAIQRARDKSLSLRDLLEKSGTLDLDTIAGGIED
jgi:hypothetical protein